MDPQEFLHRAQALQPWLEVTRRQLHSHPEIGFDTQNTLALVRRELEQLGYQPVPCGKGGLVAIAGGSRPGKTILLRADMDALPLQEEAQLDYASRIPGRMHGCGHDMHTAMLLGAAKLLKEQESTLPGTVKLMFQSAEEIFQGAQDMIDHGVLEDPPVDVAVMIHVTAGTDAPSGMLMLPTGGISMTSCQQYHITVTGKGGHGSTPHLAIDPITAAAQIHLALQQISSRELDPSGYGVFTTCRFLAGETSNVIPKTAQMWGTIRTTDPDDTVGSYIRERICQISQGIGAALRCQVETEFYDYCPPMRIDPTLSQTCLAFLQELPGQTAVAISHTGGGSEDFSFVSRHVPTLSMFLTAGSTLDGYTFAQHHPQVRFDDSVLWRGSAAYAYTALRYLQENR